VFRIDTATVSCYYAPPQKNYRKICLYQGLPVIFFFLEDIASKLIFENSLETRGKVTLVRCYNNTVSKA